MYFSKNYLQFLIKIVTVHNYCFPATICASDTIFSKFLCVFMPVYPMLGSALPKKGIYIFAMDDFLQYLSKKRIVDAKRRSFYSLWVRNFYHFLGKRPGRSFTDDEIKRFLAALRETHENWRIQQATDAIRLYRYYLDRSFAVPSAQAPDIDKLWADAVDQMIVSIRLKHLSHRTEATYINWMRQFYRYVKGTKPLDLVSKHVTDFLTYSTRTW